MLKLGWWSSLERGCSYRDDCIGGKASVSGSAPASCWAATLYSPRLRQCRMWLLSKMPQLREPSTD